MRHDVFVNTIMCIYTHYLQISIFMSIFSCFQCDCWTRRLKQNYLFCYLQNLGTQGAPAALPPVSCLHSAAQGEDRLPQLRFVHHGLHNQHRLLLQTVEAKINAVAIVQLL